MGSMSQRQSLTQSILLSVGVYFILHSAAFIALTLAYRISWTYFHKYLVSNIVITSVLLLILLRGRKDFYNLETEEKLTKVNAATILTLFRITSLPSLVILLSASRVYPILPWLATYLILAFLTDLLDGYISRSLHQTTRIGQYLDSMSDYAVLLAVAITFAQYGLVSRWFFIATLVRFFAQWLMAGIVFFVRHGNMTPRSSFLGKASVFATMVVYAANVLTLFKWFDPAKSFILILEIITTLVLAISLIEKIWFFIQELQNLKALRPNQSPEKLGAD